MPPTPAPSADYTEAGIEVKKIPVLLTYRIIELFSEGLYSSPHKAVEELVSNAYDAGAQNVHVLLAPDTRAPGATLIVIDDGEGMDEEGLERHWLIGDSNKRNLKKPPRGRQQIGKFGIGKLATYVLAEKLTHITKRDGRYLAATMDYTIIPQGIGAGAPIIASAEYEAKSDDAKKDDTGTIQGSQAGLLALTPQNIVKLSLRELTEEKAKEALPSEVFGNSAGHKAIRLFGSGSRDSWTVAILSNLKDMAHELKRGRLDWLLRVAMPLRSDFKAYLNGKHLRPKKLDTKPVKRWVLGKDITSFHKPAPNDLDPTKDPKADSQHRWGLTHSQVGRITGVVEIYKSTLTEGIHRSHGFFIYVRGRLINLDDSHFGIPANRLRHGTLSRFRMEIHINRLDEELRSSRESVLDSVLLKTTQNILEGAFNFARKALDQYDTTQAPGFRAADRISQSAGSLARRPILSLLHSALEGRTNPKLLRFPRNLDLDATEDFLKRIETRSESDEGLLLKIDTDALGHEQGLAMFDVDSGVLQINTLHAFVAAFYDDFASEETLQLLSMAEVLTEAYLYLTGLDDDGVAEVMTRRNELLVQFARRGKRTANLVAQDLEDAIINKDKLEQEIVAAFQSLGFEAVRIGGQNNPDGKAVAHLGGSSGAIRRYAVSLEAKSKEKRGKRVRGLKVQTIASHRDEHNCAHAVVVGPDFSTLKGEKSRMVTDIRNNMKNHKEGKTITLITAHDLARLVRLRALKHLNLHQIRTLFQECVTPEESRTWVVKMESQHRERPPYETILNTIYELQQEVPERAVTFEAVEVVLRRNHQIRMAPDEISDLCKVLEELSPGREIHVLERTVELNQRPDLIMENVVRTLGDFPIEEQEQSPLVALIREADENAGKASNK